MQLVEGITYKMLRLNKNSNTSSGNVPIIAALESNLSTDLFLELEHSTSKCMSLLANTPNHSSKV